jgi:hypothetical protein
MKTNCTVFLIDNDEDEVLLFNDIIDHYSLPFTVQHFSTLEKTKAHLKAGNLPDGVILNVGPRQKGWVEWLKEVKHNKSFENIPVILYCINISYEIEKLQALPAIFCHYQKPTTGKGFIDILEKIKNSATSEKLQMARETMQG